MNDAQDTVPIRRVEARGDRVQRKAPRRRRGGLVGLAAVLLLGALVGGGYYLYATFIAVPDFDGDGRGAVVVEVVEGATTTQIAVELAGRGVVASREAFIVAAEEEQRIRSVQPGFYQLRAEMSGASAVALLLDPASRAGRLEIRAGVQLDDTTAGDGSVTPGVLTAISRATCEPGGGPASCTTVDELREAMAGTDPAELGVPEWALDEVARAEPARRLEGLLVPGIYDVRPGTPAVEVLQQVLAASTDELATSGLVEEAVDVGMSPYQVLVISSLAEKEGITTDMPRVARVIYNRLDAGQRLELDSMVNYPLDLQSLRTTPEDRARPGPYNSYAVAGLPPTPIAAPGEDAIAAALAPEPGPWLFFVRCEPDGTSCFGTTLEEHNENIRTAIANGAL